MNIKIYGFKLKVVNGYATTDANGTENMKQLFYTNFNKASEKTEKHHKLVFVGDFNETTSIAECNCCFYGTKIIEDKNCNDNGYLLKIYAETNNCACHLLCSNTESCTDTLHIAMMDELGTVSTMY